MQGAGDAAPLVVHQHVGVLVGQFAGEGDLVALPLARRADMFQAEHPDHLAADADARVEQGADAQRAQELAGQLAGARVLHDVVGVDGAAAVERFEVVGEVVGIDVRRFLVGAGVAAVDGDRFQAVAGMQPPDAGARHVVGLAGGLGDQPRRLQQRVVGQVAMPRQAHDEVLLGARAQQVLQLFFLGALVQFQGHAQAHFLLVRLWLVEGEVLFRQQVAMQQLAAVVLEGRADLQHAQAALRRMQVVADAVAAVLQQLLLDLLVQPVARLGLHQAGEGGVDEAAQVRGRDAEQALAAGIEEQQRPTRLVAAFEAQHAESRGDGELRHNLSRRSGGGIGMALHAQRVPVQGEVFGLGRLPWQSRVHDVE
ncbi:hypothetical protein D3C76_867810 [compost metagenome]